MAFGVLELSSIEMRFVNLCLILLAYLTGQIEGASEAIEDAGYALPALKKAQPETSGASRRFTTDGKVISGARLLDLSLKKRGQDFIDLTTVESDDEGSLTNRRPTRDRPGKQGVSFDEQPFEEPRKQRRTGLRAPQNPQPPKKRQRNLLMNVMEGPSEAAGRDTIPLNMVENLGVPPRPKRQQAIAHIGLLQGKADGYKSQAVKMGDPDARRRTRKEQKDEIEKASQSLVLLRNGDPNSRQKAETDDAADQGRGKEQDDKIQKASLAKSDALGRLDRFNYAVLTHGLVRMLGEDAIQYHARVCPLLQQHAEHVAGASLATERLRQVELACRPSASHQQTEDNARILGEMADHIRRKSAAQEGLERSRRTAKGTSDAIQKYALFSDLGVDLGGDSKRRLVKLKQDNWQARIDVNVNEASRDVNHKWLREKGEELMRTFGKQ